MVIQTVLSQVTCICVCPENCYQAENHGLREENETLKRKVQQLKEQVGASFKQPLICFLCRSQTGAFFDWMVPEAPSYAPVLLTPFPPFLPVFNAGVALAGPQRRAGGEAGVSPPRPLTRRPPHARSHGQGRTTGT